jgi:tetratricopeptide (TPR) repeat protein
LEEGERYQEGFSLAVEGNFAEANTIFEKLAKKDTFNISLDTYLKVIDDARTKKIHEITAINLFKAFKFGRFSDDTSKINLIKMALASDSNYVIPFKELGNVYYYRKDYERAILNYKKALTFDSTLTVLYYNLALSYDEAGQIKNAIFFYKKYISLNPSKNNRYIQYSKLQILELESFSF